MAVTALDHVYAETTDCDASVGFWEGVGFSFVERWESAGHRAGKTTAGSAVRVSAAVIPIVPALTPFFTIDKAGGLDAGASSVASLQPTHRGTRTVRVRDPEGRVHALEMPV